MTKIKSTVNRGMAKLNMAALKLMHGDSHFVAIVVAIIVCIALAGFFKTQITTFIQTIIGDATSNAQGLF